MIKGKKYSYFFGACLLLFALFFTACVKEEDEPALIKRVVLVYLGGDNNLSAEVVQKSDALCKAWKPVPDGKLLIYKDAMGSAPQLVEVVQENGKNVQQVLLDYEEENSADKVVFARVIREVKELYPASSYGLLLFSHASGWLPEQALINPRIAPVGSRSVLMDGKKEMELADFAAAIPDRTFDFIIFEACFMAGIEVAYELKDKADYILASSAEIVSPGFSEIYESALHYLYEPVANLTGFGQTVFNHINNKEGYARSATFSLIKTGEIRPLAVYVSENCNYSLAEDIKTYQHFDRNSYHLFFDFGQYYTSLLGTQNQKAELVRLINNCVVWKAATPDFLINYSGFKVSEHSGLTTYITQESYPNLNNAYRQLKWKSDFVWEW